MDWNALLQQMLGAAKNAFQGDWSTIAPYAQSEFTKMEQDILLIQTLHATGQMTDQQCQLHMQMQQNSIKAVLLTVEGVGILAAEQIMNAVIGVIGDVVNKAIGIAIF